MNKASWFFVVSLLLAGAVAPAQALDLEAVALLGSGTDTGDAPNNPYLLQYGGELSVTLAGFVLGARATRTIGSRVDFDCQPNTSCPRGVADLRAVGAEFGYDLELWLLHLQPRLGIGSVRELDHGRAMYLEPGAMAEVELGWIVLGVDTHYRIAFGEKQLNGLSVLGRAGLRF